MINSKIGGITMKDSILGTSCYYYKEMISNRIARGELFMDKITDGSPIVWHSGLNMYHITFSKEEVQTFYKADSFHYIISMSVTDGIGVPQFTMQFTEFDVVDFIMNIVSQLYDIMEFGGKETPAFPMLWVNRSVGSLTDTLLIDLTEIPDFPEEIPFGESILYCEMYNEPRIIRFDIKYYNKVEQRMVKTLSVPVSVTEALDIVDCFLCIVADIQLPSDQEESITYVRESLDMF